MESNNSQKEFGRVKDWSLTVTLFSFALHLKFVFVFGNLFRIATLKTVIFMLGKYLGANARQQLSPIAVYFLPQIW